MDHDKVSDLEADVVKLREAFSKVIRIKFRKQIRQRLNSLNNGDGTSEVSPMPQFPMQEEEYSDAEYEKLKANFKKTALLLQILEHKKSCPISEVVDMI